MKVIKSFVKRFLIRSFDPYIQKIGYRRVRNTNTIEKNYLIFNLINILKNTGYQPKYILDIGSNHGTWSRIWKNAFPNIKLILVEPQEWLKPSFQDLIDDGALYLPVGAGKENGNFHFTVNSERDDSSTFNMSISDAEEKGFKQIEVPIVTINRIIDDYTKRVPDIIKIDAEGLDLDVLMGASHTFGNTEIYFVEVSINGPMQDTNIIHIINYMDMNGYRVFDITDINRPFKSGVLWLMELVFVKKNGFFNSINWLA